MSLLFLVQLSATVDDPELKRILEKHIQALGGRAQMNDIQTIRSRGIVDKGVSQESITVVRKRPNKIRLNLRSDANVTIAYDGTEAWLMIEQNGNRTFPESEQAMQESVKRDALFWLPPSTYEDTLYRFERLDDMDLNGRPQIVVAVTIQGMPGRNIYYIDAETYLISRGELVVDDLAQSATEYSDYRPVNGVLFPYSIVSLEGEKSVSVLFKSIDLNKGVFDSYFKKP